MAPKNKSKTMRQSPKSKSKRKSPKGKRKSPISKFGGSSPGSKLKLEHLPNDMLQLVYDKIPSGRDRVALASTSRQMNNVPYAFESAEHFIRTQADVAGTTQTSIRPRPLTE